LLGPFVSWLDVLHKKARMSHAICCFCPKKVNKETKKKSFQSLQLFPSSLRKLTSSVSAAVAATTYVTETMKQDGSESS